jgi:hypothetical protein
MTKAVQSINGNNLRNNRTHADNDGRRHSAKPAKKEETQEQEVLSEFSLVELVTAYEKYDYIKDEADAALKVIKEEMGLRLDAEKVKGKPVAGWSINKVTRPVLSKVPIETARDFGAIKEAVDLEKLGILYRSGAKIPGVVISTYIDVRKMKEPEVEA